MVGALHNIQDVVLKILVRDEPRLAASRSADAEPLALSKRVIHRPSWRPFSSPSNVADFARLSGQVLAEEFPEIRARR